MFEGLLLLLFLFLGYEFCFAYYKFITYVCMNFDLVVDEEYNDF